MPDRIFEKAFWSGLLFGFTDSLASFSKASWQAASVSLSLPFKKCSQALWMC
jgi:hypothetical protein